MQKSCLFAIGLVLVAHAVRSQTTEFTYQGQFNSGMNPVAGLYDIRCSLYTASSGGAPLAGPATNSAVVVPGGR